MDGEYKRLDSNADGIVTKAELEAQQTRTAAAAAAQRARAIFVQMDSDRNGQLSPDEWVRANVVQLKKIDATSVLARLDTNRDQKVTLVEYRVLTLMGFDRFDSDKDGVLTAAEQKASGLFK